jgi:hypothetical protein
MKITLNEYPELKAANELLKAIPSAVIAGGVARDLINGKEFEDVDIFIPALTEVELSEISIEIGCFATELKEKPRMEDVYVMSKSIYRVRLSNLDICILYKSVSSTESLISSFDMVSSQAWLEPIEDGFEVKATDLFYELNNKKVLGFYEEVAGDKRHIERIKGKYPDYLPLSLKQPKSEDYFTGEFE